MYYCAYWHSNTLTIIQILPVIRRNAENKNTNIVANNHMLLGLLPTCKVMPTWLKTKFKNYNIQQYNIIMFFYLHQIRIGEGRHSPFPLLTE